MLAIELRMLVVHADARGCLSGFERSLGLSFGFPASGDSRIASDEAPQMCSGARGDASAPIDDIVNAVALYFGPY